MTKLATLFFMAFVLFGSWTLNNKSTSLVTKTPQMVLVKGGEFLMGQADGEFDEKPVHRVKLKDFYIGKYEVTVAEYRLFVRETEGSMPAEPKWGWLNDHPIMNLSWIEATEYISWINQQTGENYRLPTEAEFEYVIRNGGKPGVFPWGDGKPKNENIRDISFSEKTGEARSWDGYDDGFAFTSPVGSFAPNDLGVHDINGNIWEWCSDWHDNYPKDFQENPTGPKSGKNKIGRGASFDSDPWHSRTASRAFVEPDFKRPGFRLAKDI